MNQDDENAKKKGMFKKTETNVQFFMSGQNLFTSIKHTQFHQTKQFFKTPPPRPKKNTPVTKGLICYYTLPIRRVIR